MNQITSFTQIETDGFTLLHGVFSRDECRSIIAQLDHRFANEDRDDGIRSSRGTVFAARNVLEIMPEIRDIFRKPSMMELLLQVPGMETGLVRCLYFDKPSDRSWSLPFHKDMTIAVKNNRLPSSLFVKPTRKAGVAHVEAPRQVLDQMLTLRIHLDDVSEQNGPLQVIAGSHKNGKQTSGFVGDPTKILCHAGDVLAMRPLISHASGHTDPDAELHRRILHLEFCGIQHLPDQFEWHTFIPIHRPKVDGSTDHEPALDR